MTAYFGPQTTTQYILTTASGGSGGAATWTSSGTSSYPGYLNGLPPLGPASPFVATSGGLLPGGVNRLNHAQMAVLLAEHKFIAMDGGDYCLFCFALDLYRNRLDHLFVIREE